MKGSGGEGELSDVFPNLFYKRRSQGHRSPLAGDDGVRLCTPLEEAVLICLHPFNNRCNVWSLGLPEVGARGFISASPQDLPASYLNLQPAELFRGVVLACHKELSPRYSY